MKIDLILIGGELIHGKRSDLNGAELARQLRPMGHQIASIITVPDESLAITRVLDFLINDKNDEQLIITSGGMGPTKDDVTKTVLSHYFSCPLEDSSEARTIVKANYARHHRQWEESVNHYQMIPADFKALNNPTGHAPGLLFKRDHMAILSLPGVPHEFASILAEQLQLGLVKKNPAKQFFTIKTKEVAEEIIFQRLCPGLWEEFEQYGPVSSLPHPGGVEISIETDPKNFPKLKEICQAKEIEKHIWQYGDAPIHQFIIEELQKKKLTLSAAESCTGGHFSHLLTEVPGSSNAFLGSIVCYSNEAKMNLLGVKKETIARYSEVSEQAAKEMAEGTRTKHGSDIGISFTGYAGPSGGTEADPTGTVYIGVSDRLGTEVFRYTFFGTRSLLKQRFSQYGFYRLLDRIKAL